MRPAIISQIERSVIARTTRYPCTRTETTRVVIHRTAEVLDALLTARIVLCMTPVERQVRLIVLATVGDRLGEIVLRRDGRFEANVPSLQRDPFARLRVE